jgi:hypothetical protein
MPSTLRLLATVVILRAIDVATADHDSALEKARSLAPPAPKAKTGGEFEGAEFWEAHGPLLQVAWREVGLADNDFDKDIVLPEIAAAVAAARADPTPAAEAALRALWRPVAPGVYAARLLSRSGISRLRREISHARASGIPTRRPNGMNRHGIILDADVAGGVTTLGPFARSFVAEYARPLARLLLPDRIGSPADDAEHFAFTVRYRGGEDISLSEHRDASVATLNVNLNVEGEGYEGSTLYFLDPTNPDVKHSVKFEPGMALVHCGSVRHGAVEIGRGERENLIVWLFGEGGQVRVSPYADEEQMSARQRWGLEPKKAGGILLHDGL